MLRGEEQSGGSGRAAPRRWRGVAGPEDEMWECKRRKWCWGGGAQPEQTQRELRGAGQRARMFNDPERRSHEPKTDDGGQAQVDKSGLPGVV